jgi:hypothetical protein
MPAPVSTEIARATLPLVVLPPLLPKRPALSMRAGYGFDAFTDDTSGEWTIVQENARIFFTDFEAAALSKILANRTSAA